jgi:regulatory protein
MKLKFEYQKKNRRRLSVFCGDEYLFSVSETTFAREDLRNGMETDDIAELKKRCQKSENYGYCLNIIAKKDYTKKEIYDKLVSRECSPAVADELVAELCGQGYIRDGDYKKAFVLSKQEHKKDGFNKIRQGLYRKGIILDAEDYDKEAEIENLRELAKGLLEKEVEPKKIIGRLIRKGYDYCDIRSVLGEYRDMDGYYEE